MKRVGTLDLTKQPENLMARIKGLMTRVGIIERLMLTREAADAIYTQGGGIILEVSIDDAILRYNATDGTIDHPDTTPPTLDDTGNVLMPASQAVQFTDEFQAIYASEGGGGTDINIIAESDIILTPSSGFVSPPSHNAYKVGRQELSFSQFWGTGFTIHRRLSVASSAVTLIADDTNDVLYGLTGQYFIRDSTGVLYNGQISPAVALSGTVDLVNDATNILTLTVASTGAVTLARTGGSRTYNVNMILLWI